MPCLDILPALKDGEDVKEDSNWHLFVAQPQSAESNKGSRPFHHPRGNLPLVGG